MKSFLLSKISDMCDTADNAADKTAIHVTQLMHGPAKLYHPHHYTVDSVLILIHMHTYSSENEFSLTYFAPQLECCTSALYEDARYLSNAKTQVETQSNKQHVTTRMAL